MLSVFVLFALVLVDLIAPYTNNQGNNSIRSNYKQQFITADVNSNKFQRTPNAYYNSMILPHRQNKDDPILNNT